MWIDSIADQDADGDLRRLYDQGRDRATGRLDAILQVHALHPAGLDGHLRLYQAVMAGSASLPRVEREWIAVVVSHENGCGY